MFIKRKRKLYKQDFVQLDTMTLRLLLQLTRLSRKFKNLNPTFSFLLKILTLNEIRINRLLCIKSYVRFQR